MYRCKWQIMRTTPDKPFIISDSPVVTWQRDASGKAYHGGGFERENVEVLLPVSPSRFDHFRYVFNNERPHEGLNNQVPASLFHPNSVRLPRKSPEFTYPKGLLLRRANNSGDISWHKNRVFISEVFRFEELVFELITPGFYRVFFREMEIGELNSEELRFRAARRVVRACR
jgi:hypothetical protein